MEEKYLSLSGSFLNSMFDVQRFLFPLFHSLYHIIKSSCKRAFTFHFY